MLVSIPVFRDVFTGLMWAGAFTSFGGTAWYSYERTQSAKKAPEPAPKGILKTEDTSLLSGDANRTCGGCFPWV